MKKLTPAQEHLGLKLFDINAVKFGAFKLKLHETQPDAPLSPIYFDLRTPDNPKPGPITPDVMDLIGRVLYSEALRLSLVFDHFAGIPHAGTPFADAFGRANESDLGGFGRLYFHKEKDGEKRHIGDLYGEAFVPGQSVLLIDDLVTKAGTKFEAIKSVEAADLKVAGILVLIDREQGGRQQLEVAGHQVFSIYGFSDLLEYYVAEGRITQEKADEVTAYIKVNS